MDKAIISLAILAVSGWATAAVWFAVALGYAASLRDETIRRRLLETRRNGSTPSAAVTPSWWEHDRQIQRALKDANKRKVG